MAGQKKLFDLENKAALEIALVRAGREAEWHVDWIVFQKGDLRSSIRSRGPRPMARTFSTGFLEAILPNLPDADCERMVATSQAFVELPRLLLGKMRIFFNRGISVDPEADQRTLVRFEQVLGDVQEVLAPALRTSSMTDQTLEVEASKVLVDLLRPCLDLANLDLAALETHDDLLKVAARLRTLAGRREEMELFAGLLSRYIARPRLVSVDGRRRALQSVDAAGNLVQLDMPERTRPDANVWESPAEQSGTEPVEMKVVSSPGANG